MICSVRLPYPNSVLNPNARPSRREFFAAKKAAKFDSYYLAKAALGRDFMRTELPDRILYSVEAFTVVDRGRDDDNLVTSLKAHRDGIAEAMGVDDKRFKLDGVEFLKAPKGELPHVIIHFREPS